MNPHPRPTPANPSRLVPAAGDPVSSLWRRLRRGTRLLRKSPDWERSAGDDWADRIMAEPVTDRLHAKQGRSIGRLILTRSGTRLSVYLKRHFKLPWWCGLLATLFPNRAWSPGLEEWQHLAWAKAEGFAVPQAVAAGQFVGPCFRLQGFIAVEELDGMLPLHEAVPLAWRRLDPAAFARWKRGLVAELARVARELHRRRVYHQDLYFCHFYIPAEFTGRVPPSWHNRAVMIDLHRLRRRRFGLLAQVKDLAQLLYSSDVPGVTARDRLRFWKLYRRGWPGRPPGVWLRPLVRLKWRLYRRHNRRRPSAVPFSG